MYRVFIPHLLKPNRTKTSESFLEIYFSLIPFLNKKKKPVIIVFCNDANFVLDFDEIFEMLMFPNLLTIPVL